MNERIIELWEKAQTCVIDTDCSDYHERLQLKFAELIVRECVGCCEQVISDPVPKSVDTFLQGGIHCIDEIKEHFGVEE